MPRDPYSDPVTGVLYNKLGLSRYVLAVMIGARRGRVSERKLRRESFADRQRRASVVRRLSLHGFLGSMLIEGSPLCRRRDT